MKTAEIGLNITENGMEFVGLDALNEMIRQGHRVARVSPGEVLVAELESDGQDGDDEGTEYSLSGFTMQVELEEP